MFDSFVEPTNLKRGAALRIRNRRTALLTISSALFAVAPKCPICFLAYFGIFGVAAASTSAYRVWLPPVTGFWLALTIVMLGFQRRGKHRYGPVITGVVAALLLLIGKFMLDSQVMTFAGLVTFLGAAVWNSRLREPISPEVCSQCEESATNP